MGQDFLYTHYKRVLCRLNMNFILAGEQFRGESERCDSVANSRHQEGPEGHPHFKVLYVQQV